MSKIVCYSTQIAHGGEITVSDKTPTDTVFTFTIPSGEVEVHIAWSSPGRSTPSRNYRYKTR